MQGGSAVGNDLCVRTTAIAIAMIAIVMGIDQRVNLARIWAGIGIGAQHVLGQRHQTACQ